MTLCVSKIQDVHLKATIDYSHDYLSLQNLEFEPGTNVNLIIFFDFEY